jgi:hypothetical protein
MLSATGPANRSLAARRRALGMGRAWYWRLNNLAFSMSSADQTRHPRQSRSTSGIRPSLIHLSREFLHTPTCCAASAVEAICMPYI